MSVSYTHLDVYKRQVTQRWQWIGDVGGNYCWKSGITLGCSANEEEEEGAEEEDVSYRLL